MRFGRRLRASATVNWCRSRTRVECDTRCKPSGEQRSILKESRGRGNITIQKDQTRASAYSRVETDVLTSSEAIASLRETSTLCWRGFPRLGAVCRLRTSSYRSIRNLSNGLKQIRRLNGGHLAGVKAVLKATPERVSYKDRSGVNHTTVVYILSLEVGGRDMLSLLAGMDKTAKLFQQGYSSGGSGTQYIVREV
jgi:Recombination directionality factor-like